MLKVKKPSPGDFVNLVTTDFKSIGEKFDINAICALSREDFRKHIKKRITKICPNRTHANTSRSHKSQLNNLFRIRNPKIL